MSGTEAGLRSLRHPGPVAPERARVAPCRASRLSLRLSAGQSVNAALTGALAKAGYSCGYVHLENVAISPMRYVIPAVAPDASHVAWYSDTRAPDGIAVIEQAGAIVGIRDGAPFVHCHGIWCETNGVRSAGHLLPHDAMVASDATVLAWGIEGAGFVARDDEETNFKLFSAEAKGAQHEAPNALACTVRPNGDISRAIEDVCLEHSIRDASVFGVGSLVGVDFTDGRYVPSYATEVFVTEGSVRSSGCTLDVALVDMSGAIHEGRLVHGENPVCVTFELLIVANRPWI